MNKEKADAFKDTISIVNKEGKRRWVYPEKPKGKLYTARTIVSIFLLAFLFGVPFVKVNGHPLMLFDIMNRHFILFGTVFSPQDFYLFGLVMISGFVFLFLITAVFGRIFCGWICPQTIFLEMVFRKIEYFIEGDYTKQIALNNSPWTGNKIMKKSLKYSVFFLLSFIIANTFLAYLIGIDRLWTIITDPPSKHISGLVSILIFTGLFYFVFAWFREQACILVCPYGRLQSVLLNKNSFVIAYDFVRGEPRGKIKQSDNIITGDCIDCNKCVRVCPTGIDIRNGTQLECVNCTACIDACNSIMDSVNRPRGLIRYDSIDGIENKKPFRLTPRVVGYSVVLIILISTLSVLFAVRKEIDVHILRTQGMLYQNQADNRVSNIYNFKISNKTFDEFPVSFRLINPEGEIKLIGNPINLRPEEIYEGSFFVILSKDKIKIANTPLKVGVFSNEKLIDEINTSFLGPIN